MAAAAAVAAAVVAVVAVDRVVAAVATELARPDFRPVAVQVGEAWAREIVRSLRGADRAITGAWPGTLGEARMRLRAAVRSRLELDVMDELARVVYLAARQGWKHVSEVDPE